MSSPMTHAGSKFIANIHKTLIGGTQTFTFNTLLIHAVGDLA